MKQLIGLLYQIKYQVDEYIPNSLPDDQLAVVQHSLNSITNSIEELDFYINNRLALILETAPIIEQIEILCAKLIENGLDPDKLEMTALDMNRIINIFTQELEQPHNAEYLLQILHYAVNKWLYEQDTKLATP